MNTLLIILGILIFSIGVGRASARKPDSSKDSDNPKSNDLRIVKRASDGRYVVESYSEYPQWIELGRVDGVATEQEAKDLLKLLRDPAPKNEVVLIYPSK